MLALAICCLVATTLHGGLRENDFSSNLAPDTVRAFVTATFVPWSLVGTAVALGLGASVIPVELRRGRSLVVLAGPMARSEFLLQCWASIVLVITMHFGVGILAGAIAVKLALGITPSTLFWAGALQTLSGAMLVASIALALSVRYSPFLAGSIAIAVLTIPTWLFELHDHSSTWIRIMVRAIAIVTPAARHAGATADGLVRSTTSQGGLSALVVVGDDLCYSALVLWLAAAVFKNADIGLRRS